MHAGREFMERFWYHVKKLVNAHTDNQENPHRVTKEQIGLGSVPNVSTNDQAPTFTAVNEDTALTSGEKLSTLLGKVARTVLSVISLKEEVSRLNGNKFARFDTMDSETLSFEVHDADSIFVFFGNTYESSSGILTGYAGLNESIGYWSNISDVSIKRSDKMLTITFNQPFIRGCYIIAKGQNW